MNRHIARLLQKRDAIQARITVIDIAADLIVNGTAEACPLELAILDRANELAGIKGRKRRGV